MGQPGWGISVIWFRAPGGGTGGGRVESGRAPWGSISFPKISSPADAGDEILPGCAGFNDSFPNISSPADASDETLPGCARYLLSLKRSGPGPLRQFGS